MTRPTRQEQLAAEWLRANDWDYQKYGDRRDSRDAYSTRMNYEISDLLDWAFQAGFEKCRELAVEAADQEREACWQKAKEGDSRAAEWGATAQVIRARISALGLEPATDEGDANG